MREIDAQTLLTGVLLHEVRRHRADFRTRESREIAVGRLDLDHLGAEVVKHSSAVRPGENPSEVEHPHSIEWRASNGHVPMMLARSVRDMIGS